MSDPAARLRLRLDAARRRWQTDHGGVAVREMVAIAAVTVLELAGIDITDWMREQLGMVP